MNTTPLPHDEISSRARALWLAAGSPSDRDVEFWLAAEREIAAGREALTDRPLKRRARPGRLAADEIDETQLADRLNDFGGPRRSSVSSAEPQT